MNEELLEKLSQRVSLMRLEAPAIFFLELYKPLMGLFGATALLAEPLLYALAGQKKTENLRQFLESRENLECLIARIESKAANRSREAG